MCVLESQRLYACAPIDGSVHALIPALFMKGTPGCAAHEDEPTIERGQLLLRLSNTKPFVFYCRSDVLEYCFRRKSKVLDIFLQMLQYTRS